MDDFVTMTVILQFALLPILWSGVSAIDCYKCYSWNKSDGNCGDPFHPAFGTLVKDCTQNKDGHYGEFNAKFCIKLIGRTVKDDTEMVLRGCSLETLDSQCGDFKYEDTRYRGCVMSCTEDACNSAMATLQYGHVTQIVILASLLIAAFLIDFRNIFL